MLLQLSCAGWLVLACHLFCCWAGKIEYHNRPQPSWLPSATYCPALRSPLSAVHSPKMAPKWPKMSCLVLSCPGQPLCSGLSERARSPVMPVAELARGSHEQWEQWWQQPPETDVSFHPPRFLEVLFYFSGDDDSRNMMLMKDGLCLEVRVTQAFSIDVPAASSSATEPFPKNPQPPLPVCGAEYRASTAAGGDRAAERAAPAPLKVATPKAPPRKASPPVAPGVRPPDGAVKAPPPLAPWLRTRDVGSQAPELLPPAEPKQPAPAASYWADSRPVAEASSMLASTRRKPCSAWWAFGTATGRTSSSTFRTISSRTNSS